MKISGLLRFMQERQRIYERRARGDAPPWTRDPVLRIYKFTNVYREHDRMTRWIDDNIRQPYDDHPNLWLMLAIARVGFRSDALEDLIRTRRAWPASSVFSVDAFDAWLATRRKAREKTFLAAYQVNPQYTMLHAVRSLWAMRRALAPELRAASLQRATEALSKARGVGRFIAYEVACDLRHTQWLANATDVRTWASSGPGSSLGMSIVVGAPPTRHWPDADFSARCIELLRWIEPRWGPPTMLRPRLELRDIEHSLCEMFKWHRATVGNGRLRQRFYPTSDE